MAIDNPMDAFEQQYMREERELPQDLANLAGKLAFPDNGLALEILQKAAGVLLDRVSIEERFAALWKMFVMEIGHLETSKASNKDVQQAIQMAFFYDRQQRDDKKRERYVKVIGNALRSESEVQEVTTFIQTVEQLGERDLTALKVLNLVMNKDGDWRPPNTSGDVYRVAHNIFRDRAQELGVQMAMAFGQSIETNLYSREEGYAVCTRLVGFGLAHEIDIQPRELPLTNYVFRLSVRGLTLLSLLGENAPNLDHYTAQNR